jgi:hypothetical protein
MFPRSGGEKVYLEAVYKKPKFLATIIFAVNSILLGFTAAGCIVSSCQPPFTKIYLDFIRRSLPASKFGNRYLFSSLAGFVLTLSKHSCRSRPDGRSLGRTWNCRRGYVPSILPYIASPQLSIVIVFATILHGLTPKLGIAMINVCISAAYFNVNMGIDIVCQALSLFNIAIVLLIVIAGASDTVPFFAFVLTVLVRMGCTRWKNSCS